MAVNKSASYVGEIQFKNGNSVRLWIGSNGNTGETIVWQRLNGGRSKKMTGRNIAALADELDHVLNEGEAIWVGQVNDAALAALRSK